MARSAAVWLIGLQATACLAADRSETTDLKDLYFGEAVYYAHQGYWFEALERLDAELAQHYGLDEPQLDSFYYHLKDAEFSVGDFELRYRMHHRAGRAITAVLEGAVEDVVRNDAAYRLAKIHFEKGQLEDALQALDRIDGRIPEEIRDDIEFLRANIYLATERSIDAIDVLGDLQGSENLTGFADYNLGIAFLESGQQDKAFQQLAKAGQVAADDLDTMAIRDKSNLVLGTLLFEAGSFDEAAGFLDRVRLEGPFSDQALLRSGWASASAGNYERAVVPWGILADRDATDSATQEAMLALPYAYGQLNVHGRAAVMYGRALESFGGELEKLDASITSIREGKFLKALVRQEIRQDKDWVMRLRALPEAPETYYLMDLMASHQFQAGLQNYLDLEDLRKKLAAWEGSFDAFDDIVGLRRAYYEPLLPDVDQQFRELDSRMRLRLEQHKLLNERLQSLLVAPQPHFLATVEERQLGERLDELASELQEGTSTTEAALQRRVRRLQGLLTFTLRTEYHERLTVFDRHLRELEGALAVLTAQYDAFVRARQAATHSYEGYDTPISRLRARVAQRRETVELLMARQGHLLEVVAIDELTARRERLETYQDQARYALADSYDRAAKAQSEAEVAAVQSSGERE
jgi:predicted negative regulator of RcsB-dependent stress response